MLGQNGICWDRMASVGKDVDGSRCLACGEIKDKIIKTKESK